MNLSGLPLPPPHRSLGAHRNTASGAGPAACSGPALPSFSDAPGTRHSASLPTLTCAPEQAASPPSQYGANICSSPAASTVSDESMDDHGENLTPPETPPHEASPLAGATAEQIGRLSLEQAPSQDGSPRPHRGRGLLSAAPAMASKRSASSELPRPPGHQPLRCCDRSQSKQTPRMPRAVANAQRPDRQSQGRLKSGDECRSMINGPTKDRPAVRYRDQLKAPFHRDSGYDSTGSRGNTLQYPQHPTNTLLAAPSSTIQEHDVTQMAPHRKGLIQLPASSRFPGLLLQPDSSPISQDQLAAEVKGIYAGLVMVEAKCINIDAAQAADPKSQLSPEQWQALIALHRTLLYEHHDFLMATQHPSATQALRGLATKYSMPARMWKHGIHAFLEVLRHRRPHSQDYMLAFIYLAYQMMALLFETVPSFTDTWIECLGDLARYRMAIEEEKEAHSTWGGVAARWYTMASDRHPAIGRLYHHLGILERPSLRKFCLYAKSLTCVIPFPNARDSLSTLCAPIVQDEKTIQSSSQLAEARIVTFHALVYSRGDSATIEAVGADALELLHQQCSKFRDFGAYLAITNTAALFELGSPMNMLWQHYTTVIQQAMQGSRPSNPAGGLPNLGKEFSSTSTTNTSLLSSTTFWLSTFNSVLGRFDRSSLRDYLPFLHVMLSFLHSLHGLRTRLADGQPGHTFESPIVLERLAWGALAGFLNALTQEHTINARVLECARQGVFLAPERKEDGRPLPEDYLIRGLIWGQFYFRPGWFDGQAEDDGRSIETPSTQLSRAERVLWLGLYWAFHTEHLHYDVHRKVFTASEVGSVRSNAPVARPAEVEVAGCAMELTSEAPTPGSRSSIAVSSSDNSEDGFTIVKPSNTMASPKHSWAKVAAKPIIASPLRKQKQNVDEFRVADENGMVWSGDGENAGHPQNIHGICK